DERFAEQEGRFQKMFDERFAEQDEKFQNMLDARLDKHTEEVQHMLDARLDKHNEELNAVMDARFTDIIETLDNRIAKRIDEVERKFTMIIENKLMPMLKLHLEVLPDAHRSYTELEGRVEKLELEQIVIKNAIKARL
ncbi:MAG: hypothetical protein Q4A65_02645, partial [Bacillota bacterium]|nr:hypothetical protein [Bacillota bacterium]